MASETTAPQHEVLSDGISQHHDSDARVHRPVSRSWIAEYAESLLVTILLALFVTTFIVQAFKIPSQSMEPTLLVGDHLLVNKFIFEGNGAWYEKILPYRPIHRGDVIVFKFPFDDHPHYVKRVIGLPGDHLRIINQEVFVNGKRLNEPYVVHDPTYSDPFGDNFPPTNRYFLEAGLRREWGAYILDYVQHGELVVPDDAYFAMGDNRDRSWDSRYWGFVHRDAIIGRPMLIYWSVQATSNDYVSRDTSGVFHGLMQTLMHLRTKTRWHRMLRLVR
ncbi:MAG: signal peptidase I [Candidatus Acidiferrales bacterium]